MSFVTDPFVSMTVGDSILPPGWTSDSGVGTVEVGSESSLWPLYNWYNFVGLGLGTFHFGPARATSTYFGFNMISLFPGGDIAQFQTLNDSGTYETCLTMVFESDQSISIYTPGELFLTSVLIGNSGSLIDYGFQLKSWFYAQVNITIISVQIGAFWRLNFAVQIAVDGITIINGAANSGIDPNQLEGGILGAGISKVKWFAGSNGVSIGLSQVNINTLQPINHYPDMRTPNAKISQFAIEPAVQPITAAVRTSQLVNELAKLPSSANLRISQLVIELATPNKNLAGWIVSES